MAAGMVDMHSHILPGVDDGAGSMEEALSMLRTAAGSGIREMILTPHYKEGRHNAGASALRGRLERLRAEAKREGLPIVLHLGNEVLYFAGMVEGLEEGRILTLAGSRYVLVEFYPGDAFPHIRDALDGILGTGYEPVLAHVERYECLLREWGRVRELREAGTVIQANTSGVSGAEGYLVKRFLDRLFGERLVDCLGTDAHDSGRRGPEAGSCLARLYRRYGPDYADAVCRGNAMRMIRNEDIRE